MSDTITFAESEVAEGQLKTYAQQGTKVLVGRLNGQLYAVQGTCPHYGAELAEGALCDGRIICPWHHASFELNGGELKEPPALEGLKRYPLRLNDGTATITLDPQPPETPQARPQGQGQTCIILGGGAAGFTAAQTLRERGYAGKVTVLSSQRRAPYDRPNVSKDYLAGKVEPGDMPLEPQSWYAEHHIELRLNTRVESVDLEAHTLSLHGGETLPFNQLIVATGGLPRELKVPGVELGQIETLRRQEDAERILNDIQDAHKVVIVGASFIGLEAAASLMSRKNSRLQVTVVGQEQTPFEHTLGPDVGRALQKLHESKGVTFRLGAEVERFEGDVAVSKVVLKGGETLDADVVLLGLGVRPATDMLPGELLTDQGEVKVDAHLRAAPDVYACGDIARFPDPRSKGDIRVEHWRLAEQHGRVAGANVAGVPTTYKGVPFFWTQQYGQSLRYLGHADKWDETITWGDVNALKFLVFYVQEGAVKAAASVGYDTDMAALEGLMLMSLVPTPAELKAGEFDLRERLNPKN